MELGSEAGSDASLRKDILSKAGINGISKIFDLSPSGNTQQGILITPRVRAIIEGKSPIQRGLTGLKKPTGPDP